MIRRLSVLIMSIGLSLALVLAPTASSADDEPRPNPITKTLQKVKALVTPKNVQAAVDAPDPPASDHDISPNETENPVGPDHGSTRGVDTKLFGADLIGLNHDNATIEDNDRATADSTALSLLGTELAGAHAQSDGDQEDHFDLLAPLCLATGGGVCVSVLYADAYASNDGTTSESYSQSGLADVCLGGSSSDPLAFCDGPIELGVANSQAGASRDLSTGQTEAFAVYQAAGTCLLGTPTDCGIFADALSSFGAADSGAGGDTDTSARGSGFLNLGVGGSQFPLLNTPAALPLFLADLFLNQGESYDGLDTAGTAQDALILNVLPFIDPPLEFTGVGHTETLVHNDGRNPDGDDPDGDDPDGDDPDGDDPDGDDPDGDDPDGDDSDEDEDSDEDSDSDDDGDRALPGTGGPSSALLAMGLLGVGLGGATIAYGRRPRSLREQG